MILQKSNCLLEYFSSIKFSGKFLQNAAAISINLAQLVTGFTVGWSSPIFPLLISDQTPLADGPISVDEASWITSVYYLGGCVGCVVFGRLPDYIGRKWTIVFAGIPHICAYILTVVARNGTYLLISRALSGIASNVLFIVVPMFISEIAESKNRGKIGSWSGIFITLGIALGYLIGTFFHMKVGGSFCLVILGFFLLTTPFFPETPPYLLMKKREDESFKTLMFYRGFRKNDVVSEGFLKEFEGLKTMIVNASQKGSVGFKDFKPSSTRKAILICFILYLGRVCCGLFQMEGYGGTVLNEAGSGIGGNISTIVSAVSVHILSYVSMMLIERIGRRKMMLFSTFGSGIFSGIVSIMIWLRKNGIDTSSVNWLPTLAYTGYSVIAVYGIIVLPMIISTEILPIKIKSLILLCMFLMSNILTAVSVTYFMTIADFFGFYFNIGMFSFSCFLEFTILYFLLPETKGKSFDEIVKVLQWK
ncbi:facilitated trehalose transporter Tret1-like [Phlebotomus papatasi]|uniref:facilitated trehalose transporter Tret1-like n=1 Tax=Phlebotomus papatasi TaxID=29031 RepID=UPI002484190F|nr:facilitated trehalose transporter Tret1-like [Phlebotomus papatasi]